MGELVSDLGVRGKTVLVVGFVYALDTTPGVCREGGVAVELYPSHRRPVDVQRLHSGFSSSHLTLRTTASGQHPSTITIQ